MKMQRKMKMFNQDYILCSKRRLFIVPFFCRYRTRIPAIRLMNHVIFSSPYLIMILVFSVIFGKMRSKANKVFLCTNNNFLYFFVFNAISIITIIFKIERSMLSHFPYIYIIIDLSGFLLFIYN